MRAFPFGFAIVLALAATGCKKDDDLPVTPGGGPGSGSQMNGPDAAAVTVDGAVAFRACLVTDLRGGAACATTGAGGLTVTLGGATATTADDGTFQITPSGTDLIWNVSGPSMVTSLEAFGTVGEIPVVTTDTYQTLVAQQGAVIQSGFGSTVVTVFHGGTTEAGVTASTIPAEITYFDISDSPFFTSTTDVTGAHGTTWIIDAPVGTMAMKLTSSTPASDGGLPSVTLTALEIANQAITFSFVDLP